jgi:hypothetical protein
MTAQQPATNGAAIPEQFLNIHLESREIPYKSSPGARNHPWELLPVPVSKFPTRNQTNPLVNTTLSYRAINSQRKMALNGHLVIA